MTLARRCRACSTAPLDESIHATRAQPSAKTDADWFGPVHQNPRSRSSIATQGPKPHRRPRLPIRSLTNHVHSPDPRRTGHDSAKPAYPRSNARPARSDTSEQRRPKTSWSAAASSVAQAQVLHSDLQTLRSGPNDEIRESPRYMDSPVCGGSFPRIDSRSCRARCLRI